MFRLEDLALFVRAAALSSFSDAAREAGLQPSQVSAAIKRLETTLNIRLFARSTRSLRLTPEGETWLPYATQMIDTLHAGLQKITSSSRNLTIRAILFIMHSGNVLRLYFPSIVFIDVVLITSTFRQITQPKLNIVTAN